MSGTSAVIPAAGSGERFGRAASKIFALAAGKPLLAHTLSAFERCSLVDEIVLVVREREVDEARRLAENCGTQKLAAVVAGGDHRQDSVERGLQVLSAASSIVAIHDGARPLVSRETIEATIVAAREHGAAVAAMPVVETIKSAARGDFVASTLDRRSLWTIQTPQTFDRELILTAYRQARADGFYGTDDAALVERLGHPVKLVPGDYDNIKVTTPLDLEFVESRISRMQNAECGMRNDSVLSPQSSVLSPGSSVLSTQSSALRVGFGYDVHRFQAGRKLVLGGVELPGEEGLAGHSDADVILHAVADALLGAAALGDIGRHFPDTDPAYRGISSIVLLERTAAILVEAGWAPVNVDATLVAERPKIAPRVPEMQERIAAALGIDPSQVSVKATTAEGLGEIGTGQGAACYAAAVVRAR